jgi:histidinol dehydrogenase
MVQKHGGGRLVMNLRSIRGKAGFYFIRHGESEGNRAGVMQGRVPSTLTETGKAQAREAGTWLGTRGIDVILTSPLARARQTAEIVAREAGIADFREIDDLTELDIGIFSNLSHAQARAGHPDAWTAFMREGWQGVPGAERAESLLARAEKVWGMLIGIAAGGTRNILSVTHAGFLQWMIRSTLGAAHWMPLISLSGNCAVSHLLVDNQPLDDGSTKEQKRSILARSEMDITRAMEQVRVILDEIKAEGDAALIRYTLKFDKVDLGGKPLRVSEREIAESERAIPKDVAKAIRTSVANVRACHEDQLPGPMKLREVSPGVFAGERATPIASVGLYAPRGKGSFPSSMYMLAVPASVAGVERVVVVTPPDAEGRCDPATLFAAGLCGIREIYRIGGVQAIAALAYGTESVPPVVKILGPGSRYVTAAKRLLFGTVDVGLPAGPTESLVIADGTTDPRRAALDLLIEAEHGPDSQALLVTPDAKLASQVAAHVEKFANELPEPRKSYVESVFAGYGGIILTSSMEEAVEVANSIAPEHLQIAVAEPLAILGLIRNAGEILLGQHTPFSLANYSIGANAVLPTGGAARTYSALSTRDFMKWSSIAYVTEGGYSSLKETAIALADYEGFAAHAKALRERG